MTQSQRPVSVIVLDRSPIFVEGLRALFSRHPQIRLRRTAATVESALTAVMADTPDLLLVSSQLAIPDAVQLARRCSDVSPGTRVLFMADSDDFTEVVSRSKVIASVFIVSRVIEPETLAWVVQTVACGGALPSGLPVHDPQAKTSRPSSLNPDDVQARLTQRELEITRLVAQGLSNKSIAEIFRIRQGTVKVHVSNIFRKLGVSNRIGLLRILDMR